MPLLSIRKKHNKSAFWVPHNNNNNITMMSITAQNVDEDGWRSCSEQESYWLFGTSAIRNTRSTSSIVTTVVGKPRFMVGG